MQNYYKSCKKSDAKLWQKLRQFLTGIKFRENQISHYLRWVVTHAPFHASVLRPASQVGPMHKILNWYSKLFHRCKENIQFTDLFSKFSIPVKYSSLTADNLCNHKQNWEKLENLWQTKMVFNGKELISLPAKRLPTFETNNWEKGKKNGLDTVMKTLKTLRQCNLCVLKLRECKYSH